jgi:hypothetical protein
MGVQHFALNHERREVFDLDKFILSDEIVGKNVDELRTFLWSYFESRPYWNITQERAYELASELAEFKADEVWTDAANGDEYFACYLIVGSICGMARASHKLGYDLAATGAIDWELLDKMHPEVMFVNGKAHLRSWIMSEWAAEESVQTTVLADSWNSLHTKHK